MSGDLPRPGDDESPFGGLPFFGDMMKMFAGQGPIQWDTARQIALLTATEGRSENNPDPAARVAFVDLARIVSLQIQSVTGRPDASLDIEPNVVTRAMWVQRTLDDFKPLFTDLATALQSGQPSNDDDTSSDPFAAMFSQLSGMLAPVMMGMTVGSMVGLLARRAFGQYDLPLPRSVGAPMFVIDNIDTFADEWSLPRDDVRMWTLINEYSLHTVLGITHVRERLDRLVRRHAASFRPNPSAISDKLSSLESDDPMAMMQSLQKVFADPEVLLGAVRTPEQDALQPELDVVLALVVGWADHIADQVGARILGNPGRLAEAARRRRIESGDDTAFVEKLLGLRLNRSQVERGKSFVAGVIERAGSDGLSPLLRSAEALPTVAEIDAPGLWLARLDVSPPE
jgi:putative hydrolase